MSEMHAPVDCQFLARKMLVSFDGDSLKLYTHSSSSRVPSISLSMFYGLEYSTVLVELADSCWVEIYVV